KMGKDSIEARRRRRGAPPTERADAPRRETGGGSSGGGGFQIPGGGLPRPPGGGGFSTRGKQVGGCGSILIFLVMIAIYMFSNSQFDFAGEGSDPSGDQAPFPEFPQQALDTPVAPVSNFTPPV